MPQIMQAAMHEATDIFPEHRAIQHSSNRDNNVTNQPSNSSDSETHSVTGIMSNISFIGTITNNYITPLEESLGQKQRKWKWKPLSEVDLGLAGQLMRNSRAYKNFPRFKYCEMMNHRP